MPESVTLMELLQRSTPYLAERGIVNARRETEWIFAETLGLSRLDLYTRFDMPVAGQELSRLRERVVRRGRREPLAYVLGNQPFCGLDLTVTPAVLVPRPETEELVALVLGALAPDCPARLLDVGTGSGAIALAIRQARPLVEVEATECSDEALAVARANAERLNLPVAFHHDNLAQGRPGGWDVVVANLPYVAEAERDLCDPETAFEPAGALFAADDGLALIAALIADACRLLAADGKMFLEIGFTQGPAVADLAAAQHLTCVLHPDAAGHQRIAVLQQRDDQ